LEAYIFVKIAGQSDMCGYNRSVLEKIAKIKGVKDAQLLFGDYDAIVFLDLPKIHDIENTVMEEIHLVAGVESTLTLLSVDEDILE
jgi:DNA-binding Lrp family transcriptional regulator